MLVSHIDNPAQRPYSIGSVNDIAPHRGRILHDRARNHNDILSSLCQLLDHQIHHLSQAGILILKELGDAKEQGGRFVGGELLPSEEEQRDLGEEDPTSSGRDGGRVEYTRCIGVSVGGRLNCGLRNGTRARMGQADLLETHSSGRP